MSFVEHLVELRDVMVRAAAAILIGFIVAFEFREPIFDFLASPMREALAEVGVYNFRAIEITETIFVYLKMSIAAGVVLTLPFTFYQLWSFIAPGLLEREKQAVAPLLFFSTVFFLLGCYFAYEVIIPFVSRYLAEMTLINPSVEMDVTVQSAFSFSLKLLLAFGVAFELPLIMFFLSFLGVVDHKKYIKFYRFFIVVSFIISAIFTPPDPISQVLMAVPLNVLYWVGVGAAYMAGKRKAEDKKLRIPSKVWGALSAALLLIGLSIVAATIWLGKTHDPMKWVPGDAQWVISIRTDRTLGDPPAPERLAALKERLGLPDEGPSLPNRIILAGGPDGARLVILVDACKESAPSVGTCEGDDWLWGTESWVEKASDGEGALLKAETYKDLTSRAPAWIWVREPDESWLKYLPGEHEKAIPLSEVTITADLRGDEPWVKLSIQPESGGEVTALQNRVDLWRVESKRRVEQAKRDEQALKAQAGVIGLLSDLVALQDQRFEALKKGLEDKEKLARLTAAEKALRDKVSKHQTALAAATADETSGGGSLLEQLGKDGVRSWQTTAEDGRLTLQIQLRQPDGVDALLGSLPSAGK